MPFLSSMRLGCCGWKAWSAGMGICSQGLDCWDEESTPEITNNNATAAMRDAIICAIPGLRIETGGTHSLVLLKFFVATWGTLFCV